jgi:hypothetical protein
MQTRQAFENLSRQVRDDVDVHDAYRGIVEPPSNPRWVPMVAVAALLALVIGVPALIFGGDDGADVADQPTTSLTAPEPTTARGTQSDEGDESAVTGAPDATVPPTTIPEDGDPSDGDATAPGIPPTTPTHRVANVASDDVLWVRVQPGAGAEPIAGLPPSYAGVIVTGAEVQADDGGVWVPVTLVDPVRDILERGEPNHSGVTAGWANAFYLEPIDQGLPVDFDRLACELGGGIGIFQTEPEGSGAHPADHVYSLRHGVDGECSRVVITLGSGYSIESAWDFIETDIRPADALPATGLANEERMTISWSGMLGARQEAMQVATPYGPVVVTMDAFGNFSVVFTFPVTGPNYRTVPEEGRIVLDYQPFLEPTPNTLDALVVAPPPVIVPASDVIPEPIVHVEGWARPFEATLGVELSRVGPNGVEPAEADFSGSFLGEVTDSRYAAMTTAWVDAWGYFNFQLTALEPGEYSLFLFSDGEEEPIGITVPLTIP